MPQVVKVVTPPAAEPVSLQDAKDHLRVTWSTDDAQITRKLAAARRYCEVVARTTFVDTVFDLVEDSFPFSGGYMNRQVRQFYGQFSGGTGSVAPLTLALNCGGISLPRGPVESVTSITYLDPNGNTVVLDPSQYDVTTGNPGRVAPAFGKVWPVTLPQIGAVRVRFVAGYGPDATTVPENVQEAVLLYLGFLYENRESAVQGTAPAELTRGIGHLLGIEDSTGGYA